MLKQQIIGLIRQLNDGAIDLQAFADRVSDFVSQTGGRDEPVFEMRDNPTTSAVIDPYEASE